MSVGLSIYKKSQYGSSLNRSKQLVLHVFSKKQALKPTSSSSSKYYYAHKQKKNGIDM